MIFRHEIDYEPVARVEYDYIPRDRSYVAGQRPGGMVSSRVLTGAYDITSPINSSRLRASSIDHPYSSYYKTPGYYYSTYNSPYK